MASYIVEVSQPEAIAARRIEDAVRTTGSHFVTHADWRRRNGARIGRLVVEADDMWGAVAVVPPNMRAQAAVFPLEPVTAGGERMTVPDNGMQRFAAAA